MRNKYITNVKPHEAEIIVSFIKKNGITDFKTKETALIYNGQKSKTVEILAEYLTNEEEDLLYKFELKLINASSVEEFNDIAKRLSV